MISVEHARTMARYNAWQNASIYAAAETLSEVERRQDRGAFFGSIQATLSHLLWGDQQWMSRFAGHERPATPIGGSAQLYSDWDDLRRRRPIYDQSILAWTEQLDPSWPYGMIRWYSGAAKRDMEKPAWFLLTHMFNHQTHHRGQVHAMLTQAGAKPQDTDLMLMDI